MDEMSKHGNATIKRDVRFDQFVKITAWFDKSRSANFGYVVKGVGKPDLFVQWAELQDYGPTKDGLTMVLVCVEPNAAFTICRAEFEELLALMGFGETTPKTIDEKLTLDGLRGRW